MYDSSVSIKHMSVPLLSKITAGTDVAQIESRLLRNAVHCTPRSWQRNDRTCLQAQLSLRMHHPQRRLHLSTGLELRLCRVKQALSSSCERTSSIRIRVPDPPTRHRSQFTGHDENNKLADPEHLNVNGGGTPLVWEMCITLRSRRK